MNIRFDHRRTAAAAAVVAATCLTGAAVAAPHDKAPRSLHPVAVDQSEVTAWARSEGLTGLSPASLSAVPAPGAPIDQSDVAAWARSKGLTGLSPASLRPAGG